MDSSTFTLLFALLLIFSQKLKQILSQIVVPHLLCFDLLFLYPAGQETQARIVMFQIVVSHLVCSTALSAHIVFDRHPTCTQISLMSVRAHLITHSAWMQYERVLTFCHSCRARAHRGIPAQTVFYSNHRKLSAPSSNQIVSDAGWHAHTRSTLHSVHAACHGPLLWVPRGRWGKWCCCLA